MEKPWLKLFCIGSLGLAFLTAFLMGTPLEIAEGMKTIILSRDALITDYFELAGYGAAFFNAGLVMGIALLLIEILKVPFTGLTMAALFINFGYGLWGKNPVSMLPLLLGTWVYARLHRTPMSRYVYTALFGTCLAPFVSEMVYLLPFSIWCNVALAAGLGIFMGYLLVPLSMHTASMHMGYTLFNVGFSGGILAFIMVCTMRSYGLESEPVFIWKHGVHTGLVIGVYCYLAAAAVIGLILCRGEWRKLLTLMSRPGRAVSDFVILDGPGASLLNMGLLGLAMLTYVLAVGGDLSGPVLGAVLVAFGFGAFGAHLRNALPVVAGVFLSTLATDYRPDMPGVQLAALFAVGLAPLAGQFGVVAGLLAGGLHVAIALCTSDFYGGLNLYNNGFSTGWVAIIMVPLCESFISGYKVHKKVEGGKNGS